MQPVHLESMDLNLLVALRLLLQERSVTAAAVRLQRSQPAVSRTLGRLRRLFEDPLLVRSAEGLVPTPRALALQPRLEDVLRGLEQVVARPEDFDPARAERTFTVGSMDYGQAVLLPVVMQALRPVAPGITLRVAGGTEEPADLLASGEWDLCWAPRYRARPTSALVWTTLYREDFSFVLSASHPRAGQALTMERFLSIAQLAIAPGGKPGNPLDDALARKGLHRRVVAHVSSFLAVPRLVAESELGAVLPRRLVSQVKARYDLWEAPLPFELKGFDVSQAWHERMRGDAGHRWLRGFIRGVTSRRLR